MPFLKSKKAGMYFCTVAKFQAFPSRFAFENVSNITKTVLVTLIALNTSYMSKRLLL